MKKWFIILLEIAVLYAIFSSPFVRHMFSGVHQTLSAWALKASEYPKQDALTSIRNAVEQERAAMSDHQQRYVDQITETSGQALRFHQLYCIEGDKNPFIYGNALQKLCMELNKNSSRLSS